MTTEVACAEVFSISLLEWREAGEAGSNAPTLSNICSTVKRWTTDCPASGDANDWAPPHVLDGNPHGAGHDAQVADADPNEVAVPLDGDGVEELCACLPAHGRGDGDGVLDVVVDARRDLALVEQSHGGGDAGLATGDALREVHGAIVRPGSDTVPHGPAVMVRPVVHSNGGCAATLPSEIVSADSDSALLHPIQMRSSKGAQHRMADDNRFLLVVLSITRVVGWLILGGAVVLVVHELKPLVELVAGRETLVDVSLSTSISVGLNVAGLAAILKLRSDNRKLRGELQKRKSNKQVRSQQNQRARLKK
jgi:hypothetical protein